VVDHRGPGDDNSLTKRCTSKQHLATTASSLSADEQRQRPVSLSSRQNEPRIIKARGDVFRTIIEKGQSSISSTNAVSLSEGEKRQRPVPSSNRNQDDGVGRISMPVLDNDDDGKIDPNDSATSTAATSPLKDENESQAYKKQASPANASKGPPIAAVATSQALPNDEQHQYSHRRDCDGVGPIRMTPLSSLLKDNKQPRSSRRGKLRATRSASNYNKKKEWWAEKPQCPRDYVKHYQSTYTSYATKKFGPASDYGDAPADVALPNPFHPLRKAGISDNDDIEEDGDERK